MEGLYTCPKCKNQFPINNKILHDLKCKIPIFAVIHRDNVTKNKKSKENRKNKNKDKDKDKNKDTNVNDKKSQPNKRKERRKSNKSEYTINNSSGNKKSKELKERKNKRKKIDKNENKKAFDDSSSSQQDFNIIDNKNNNNSNFNIINQPLSGNNGDNKMNNIFNMERNNYYSMNQVPMNIDFRSNMNSMPMNMNPFIPNNNMNIMNPYSMNNVNTMHRNSMDAIFIHGLNINSMPSPINYVQFNNVNYLPHVPSIFNPIPQNESNLNIGLEQKMIYNLPETKLRDVSKLTPDKKECSICLEEFVEDVYITYLPCIHAYHSKCIKEWLNRSNECPICKFKITKETLNYQ